LKTEFRSEDNIKIVVRERCFKRGMYVDVAQNGIQRKDIILAVSNQWDMLSVCWLHNYVPMNVTNLQSWYLKHPVKVSHYRPGQALRVTAF